MTQEHDAEPPAASQVEEAIGSEAEPEEPGRYRGTRRTPPARPRVLTGMGHVREPESERWWRSWLGRTAALLLGALILAAAFVTAYVGGLHKPTPRDIPVAVVRDDNAARTLIAAVRVRTNTIEAVEYADPQAALQALRKRSVYAILSSSTLGGTGLTLTTASASSPAATQVIEQTLDAAAAATGASLAVADVVPVSIQDPLGVVPFYLVFGFVLGGILAATALGVAVGTVPRNLDRAAMRIGALAVFSALVGTAGAIVAGPVTQVWTSHRVGVAIAGTLVTFAAAMLTSAAQGWLGLLGTGLAVLLLIALGNPGSGGIYPPEFLPRFFDQMYRWNIPGLGVSLVEGVAYFDRQATGWPITALALWALAGVLGLLLATAVLGRRLSSPPSPSIKDK
ncbi:MAG TPA: hypothetical protein VFC00_01470 [Micromonosporaceae bacterium]|nr:hypothetical protein [Micromonosporaceae bacterium]